MTEPLVYLEKRREDLEQAIRKVAPQLMEEYLMVTAAIRKAESATVSPARRLQRRPIDAIEDYLRENGPTPISKLAKDLAAAGLQREGRSGPFIFSNSVRFHAKRGDRITISDTGIVSLANGE